MIDCDPNSPCNQIKELTDAEKQKFEKQARAKKRAQARAKGRAKRKKPEEPKEKEFVPRGFWQRERALWARQNELSRLD